MTKYVVSCVQFIPIYIFHQRIKFTIFVELIDDSPTLRRIHDRGSGRQVLKREKMGAHEKQKEIQSRHKERSRSAAKRSACVTFTAQ